MSSVDRTFIESMSSDDVSTSVGESPTVTGTIDQTGTSVDGDVAPRPFRRRFETEPLGYVDSLDGIRGYSMVVVMFYHARFTFFPGGFLAVSLFFTLSGFLITSLLLREWASDGAISMRAFWSRRFRRLLPAAWVTLAGVTILGLFGVWDGDQLTSLRGDIPFSLLQVVNWHYILEQRTYGAGFVAPSPVEHYWSLAVEEQFYLFLPLSILLLLKLGRSRTLRQNAQRVGAFLAAIIVLGAILNGVLARNSIDRAYFGTDTRMPEMVAGGLLACVMVRRLRYPDGPRKRILQAVGVAGLVSLVLLWIFGSLRVSWMYPWGLLATSVTTCAIIAGSLQGGLSAKILAFKPAAQLGRMSYGTYLVHWPVFLILTPVRTGLDPWPLFGLRFVVSVSISTLMYYYIEEPVRRRRVLKERRFVAALAIALPAIILGSLFVTRNAEPTSAIQRDPNGSATSGPVTTKRRILFVGDQTAGVVAKAIGGSAEVDGKSVRLTVSSSVVPDCGLVNGGWVQFADRSIERDVDRCANAVATWSDAIAAKRPDVVILVASERDALIRRSDTTSPWTAPVPSDGADFTTLEVGRSLDTLTAAAESVRSGVIVSGAVLGERDAPQALPPRVPISDPAAEVMAAVELQTMIDSSPDPAEFPPLQDRVAELNRTVASVAANRGLQSVDISSELTRLGVDGGTVDSRSASEPLPRLLRKGLTEWIASLSLRVERKAPAPSPVPENLRDIQIPPAPDATPRIVVPSDQDMSLLVVGDSLSYNLGYGLQEWSRNQSGIQVANAGKFGCPIARGGRYRFQRDSASFDPECDWGVSFPTLMAEHRPDVVMLFSSVWQVVDRQLPGDTKYRHMGDELLDRYILSELLNAVDLLASDGATVVLLTSPHIESGREKGYTDLPESDPQRMDRMNEITRQAVELRPGVAKLIDLQTWLASQDGREMDATRRPDGIHFTDAESISIAGWLGPQLVAIGRGQ